MDAITRFANFKASAELKKSDGRKKSKLSGIAKLDDANWAGTKKSQVCSSIDVTLCENVLSFTPCVLVPFCWNLRVVAA